MSNAVDLGKEEGLSNLNRYPSLGSGSLATFTSGPENGMLPTLIARRHSNQAISQITLAVLFATAFFYATAAAAVRTISKEGGETDHHSDVVD